MKTKLFLFLILVFTSSVVFGATFAPNLLKISASSKIHYDFDGSTLEIPVYIDGTSALTKFLVFSKNQANNVVNLTNGNLGWHYTNLIDTCIFISTDYVFARGSNTITWNGNSSDGTAPVPSGEYTYYIWGYDNISPKQKVTSAFSLDWNDMSLMVSKDVTGTILSKPLLFHKDRSDGNTEGTYRTYKWAIGNNPDDTSLVESTFVNAISSNTLFCLDPADHSNLFHHTMDSAGTAWIEKVTWVPNSMANVNTSWGIEGRFTYSTVNNGNPWMMGVVDIGNNQLVCGNCYPGESLTSELIYVTTDTGDEIRRMDFSPIFMVTYPREGATPVVEDPYDASLVNGRMLVGSFYTWPVGTVNPYAETQSEFILWSNNNGDGFQDKVAGQTIWQYNYNGKQDANWFGHETAYDLGGVSFGLYAPDGTGIGYYPYVNESSGQKLGMQVLDDGTSYDGLYMDNNGTPATAQTGWWFIAHDSITGTITSGVEVSETTPAAYSVAQNTPNPFNPTTTINFNIAKAGKVTVDIYNVAGQKVDTLVNGNQSAGSHSVVWNASKFSAGVYFYTVKSGSFSKTMKMTLIK